MGKPSQRKGRRAEIEVKNIYLAHGFKCRLHDQWEAGDLTVWINDQPYLVEVKRRELRHKEVNELLKTCDVLWWRANFEDWKVATSAIRHCAELSIACSPAGEG
ncbi:hypothetical protein FBQ96_12280 [Nitrospirales bacterium NOB]|nr:hypothetical protein [Nitrospirales bacterium NOB]